jgi:hypothetical protein
MQIVRRQGSFMAREYWRLGNLIIDVGGQTVIRDGTTRDKDSSPVSKRYSSLRGGLMEAPRKFRQMSGKECEKPCRLRQFSPNGTAAAKPTLLVD